MPFLPFHHWSIVAWEGENFWIIFVWYIHIITSTIMSFNTYLANGAFSRHFLHQQQLMLHFLSDVLDYFSLHCRCSYFEKKNTELNLTKNKDNLKIMLVESGFTSHEFKLENLAFK